MYVETRISNEPGILDTVQTRFRTMFENGPNWMQKKKKKWKWKPVST